MKRKLFIGGLILTAVVVWLDFWLDERWVNMVIKREQMTVRPVSHYRRPSACDVDWA